MINWIVIILIMAWGPVNSELTDPPDVTGTWKMQITGGNISRPQNLDDITLQLEQKDSLITGTYTNPDTSEKGPIEGVIKGSQITLTRTFRVPSENNTYKAEYTGTIQDDGTMSGENRVYLMNGNPLGVPMKWRATRE